MSADACSASVDAWLNENTLSARMFTWQHHLSLMPSKLTTPPPRQRLESWIARQCYSEELSQQEYAHQCSNDA